MEEYPQRCTCGADVVLLTSWTEENPGRRFFRCGLMKKGSLNGRRHYFAWLDKPMPSRAKVVINGLLRKIDSKEKAEKGVDGESSLGFEIDSMPAIVVPTDSKKAEAVNPFIIIVILVIGILIGKLL